MTDLISPEEGWRQVRAGIALIEFSRLARWDRVSLTLTPTTAEEFESQDGHGRVHPEYGRLICWIQFGLGSEYLVKGVCILTKHPVASKASAVRFPSPGQDLAAWAKLVNSKPTPDREPVAGFKTFANLPFDKVLLGRPEEDIHCASINLLASAIRNRDAHRYVQNVRASHFGEAERLFLPALNSLVGCLEQGELFQQTANLKPVS
jgi:hypothetical protein